MLHFSAHWRGEDCCVLNLLELRGTERGRGGQKLAIVDMPQGWAPVRNSWSGTRGTDPVEHRRTGFRLCIQFSLLLEKKKNPRPGVLVSAAASVVKCNTCPPGR